MENLIDNDNNILDVITDEITLESANSINEEYIHIINTYDVMEKVINAMAKPESITTESGVNTFDNFIIEQLATVGLTKEYFGFEGELTVEAAQTTIEVDNRWTRLWEWVKAKLLQLKDWFTKVFKSIFNKSKVQYDTLEQLEKISLGKLKNDFMDNSELLNLPGFLPIDMNTYTIGLLFYNNFYKEILYTLKDVDFVSNLTTATNKVFSIIETNNNNASMNSLLKLNNNNNKSLFKRIEKGVAEYITFNVNNGVVHTVITINNIDNSVSVQPAKKYKTLTPIEINIIIKNCKKILLENINREDKILQSVLGKLHVMISDNPERIPSFVLEGNGMAIGKVTALLKILDCITTYTTFQYTELGKCIKYLALNIKNYNR